MTFLPINFERFSLKRDDWMKSLSTMVLRNDLVIKFIAAHNEQILSNPSKHLALAFYL